MATLSFANPLKRGALTPEMLRTLRSGLGELELQYPQVRVLVLRGADDTFSSGYAIDRIPGPDELRIRDEIEELCEAIEVSPLVVIAMMRGDVIGAALDIVCACDLRLAERGARLGITPAKLSLVYTLPGTARIHRLVGSDEARMLFYTGDLIEADEAARIGLVTRLCGRTDLERETYELANRIAGRAPLSVSGSKRIFREIETAGGVESGVAEELHELRRRALRSPDSTEARAAFAQKRAPRFTGRQA